jgi:hypothetical protein
MPTNSITGIDRINQRELVSVFLDAVGKPLKAARPLFDRQTRPIFKGGLGGLYRTIDVRLAGRWNIRELLHVGRIDRNE